MLNTIPPIAVGGIVFLMVSDKIQVNFISLQRKSRIMISSYGFEKRNIEVTRLNREEALRYLGVQGNSSQVTTSIIEAEKLLLPVIQGKAIWKKADVYEKEGIRYAGSVPLLGKEITELLVDAQEAVLLAATVGPLVDGLIRRLQVLDNSMALVVDALASVAVEQVVDVLEADLLARYAAEGLFLTDRFSPGYGDFPLSIQGDFLHNLDATRQIGVGKTTGDLLTPIKSVTAMIGIVNRAPRLLRRNCESCRLKGKCAFREKGGYCGRN